MVLPVTSDYNDGWLMCWDRPPRQEIRPPVYKPCLPTAVCMWCVCVYLSVCSAIATDRPVRHVCGSTCRSDRRQRPAVIDKTQSDYWGGLLTGFGCWVKYIYLIDLSAHAVTDMLYTTKPLCFLADVRTDY